MSGCGGGGDGHGGHGHDHSGHGSCEGHDHGPADLGVAYSLYTKIDTEHVECLNEALEGSGKTVFKPWEERLSTDKVTALLCLKLEILVSSYLLLIFIFSHICTYIAWHHHLPSTFPTLKTLSSLGKHSHTVFLRYLMEDFKYINNISLTKICDVP